MKSTKTLDLRKIEAESPEVDELEKALEGRDAADAPWHKRFVASGKPAGKKYKNSS